MMWNLTLLALHLAALVGFIHLYTAAPCWMQKVSVAFFVVGMGVMSLGFLLALFGKSEARNVLDLGLRFEHLAVLVYVFRLIYQKHLEWKPSSAPSRSS